MDSTFRIVIIGFQTTLLGIALIALPAGSGLGLVLIASGTLFVAHGVYESKSDGTSSHVID